MQICVDGMEDDDPIPSPTPTPTSKATAAAATATTTLPKDESAETVDRRPDHNHMIRDPIQ